MTKRLTALFVKSKTAGMYRDGGGLYLNVRDSGSSHLDDGSTLPPVRRGGEYPSYVHVPLTSSLAYGAELSSRRAIIK